MERCTCELKLELAKAKAELDAASPVKARQNNDHDTAANDFVATMSRVLRSSQSQQRKNKTAVELTRNLTITSSRY